MATFNAAYHRTLGAPRMTLGLMTPTARQTGHMANIGEERRYASRADELGFAALWTRDVPLMVPQGSDNEAAALDDPFLWLASLANATEQISVGLAAAVLTLRHPLHVAKSALSLDRMSSGRFILGLGSGDREAEFAAFGLDASTRGERFRAEWSVVRQALSSEQSDHDSLAATTGGFDVLPKPDATIPMLVVGSARQSLQWIASNADGWATYHRDEPRQQGRIGMWNQALAERNHGVAKPFVQSLNLDLLDDPDAPMEPIELGVRTGRDAFVDYLLRLEAAGIAHVMLHLTRSSGRSVLDVIGEIGTEVQPRFLNAQPLDRERAAEVTPDS